MNWTQKIMDTIVILTGIVWIQSQFGKLSETMDHIDTRLTKIETIMIMTGIMHPSLACKKEVKTEEVTQ